MRKTKSRYPFRKDASQIAMEFSVAYLRRGTDCSGYNALQVAAARRDRSARGEAPPTRTSSFKLGWRPTLPQNRRDNSVAQILPSKLLYSSNGFNRPAGTVLVIPGGGVWPFPIRGHFGPRIGRRTDEAKILRVTFYKCPNSSPRGKRPTNTARCRRIRRFYADRPIDCADLRIVSISG
jgi:hypothetical protein